MIIQPIWQFSGRQLSHANKKTEHNIEATTAQKTPWTEDLIEYWKHFWAQHTSQVKKTGELEIAKTSLKKLWSEDLTEKIRLVKLAQNESVQREYWN